jgi:hypothetical protein
MAMRRYCAFVLLGVLPAMGASYPTTNFLVEAPTPQIAQWIGQAAETYRQQKAIEWLGQEMPPWPERCPLHVRVTMSGPGGATSFAFDRGRVLGQHMNIEGPMDRLVASVLPHEVTHTVFAYYFRRPVPRWADEGGAVLSEDEVERERHDKLVRHILNTPGRKIPLRRLFALHDYPSDVMVLYAEGFSVSNFLVSRSDRRTFLEFINQGMSGYGWDNAVRTYYHFNSVDDLEEAWLAQLRSTRRPPVQLAQNIASPAPAVEAAHGTVVRRTVPPGLATQGPVFRAQADQDADRSNDAGRGALAVRPGYLPDYNPGGPARPQPVGGQASLQERWQPPNSSPPPNPSVQLGQPQALPNAPVEPAPQPMPGMASPVGYPR